MFPDFQVHIWLNTFKNEVYSHQNLKVCNQNMIKNLQMRSCLFFQVWVSEIGLLLLKLGMLITVSKVIMIIVGMYVLRITSRSTSLI